MDDPGKEAKRADLQRVEERTYSWWKEQSQQQACKERTHSGWEKSIANCRHVTRTRTTWWMAKVHSQLQRGDWHCDGGWKKPKTGDEMWVSEQVTKVDGSIVEKNELKCTVGDKFLGLLSTTIDKVSSGMLKDEEMQLKCSPEYAERANIDLTLVQVTRKRFQTRLSQRKQSQRMSLRRVSQPNRYQQRNSGWEDRRGEDDYREVYCCKCRSRGKGTFQQNTHGHIITWCRCECRARGSGSSPRANVGDRWVTTSWRPCSWEAGGCTSVRTVTIALEIFVDRTASIEGSLNRWWRILSHWIPPSGHECQSIAMVSVRRQPQVSSSQRLEEEWKVCKVLGWCQSASGLQMRRKTQVFRLLRTRSFSASHLRSNLSAMNARSWSFSIKLMSSFIQQTEMSYAAHTGQFGQIVGMLEQMLSRIQSDMWSRRVRLLIKSLWLPRMRVWRNDEAWNLVQRKKLGAIRSTRPWLVGVEQQQTASVQTVCSIARGWYPTPSEVYLSESQRRQGSVIDDRRVPGVRTEFVQRETDTLNQHHQQLEEAQLACAKQTSVRDRVVRTEIVKRCRTGWRKHARKGTTILLRMQQLCSSLGKVLTLSNSWLSSCRIPTRLPLRSLLKRSSTHSIRRTRLFRKSWRGLKVCCLSSSLSPSESSKRRMLRKMQQEAFILAERTEFWSCSRWVKAMTSMQVRYRTREFRTQFHRQHQRIRVSTEAAYSHTPRQNSGSRNSCDWACSSWLSKYRLDVEEDNCSGGARAHNRSLRVWITTDRPVLMAGANFHRYKVKRSCRHKVRGCALNSFEHHHGGENHQHCETVDQILASSSTRLEGSTTADVEMAPRVHDHTDISSGTTWRRTEMTSRGPVQRAASAPWQESSRPHAANNTVDDEVVLPGSTRS